MDPENGRREESAFVGRGKKPDGGGVDCNASTWEVEAGG